jgi:hypothetical protein
MTVDASQPRQAEFDAPPEQPPEGAAVAGMNGPRRFRARLRRVPQSNDAVAARSRSCAVCERAGPESESELLSSGWRVSEQLGLCPACQAEGWQLPEQGPLPFRYHVPRP